MFNLKGEGYSVHPVRGLPLIRFGDDLACLTVEALKKEGIRLTDGDIVVYSSKLVSKSEGGIIDARWIKPSRFAKFLAAFLGRSPSFIQLILDESDRILGVWKGSVIVEDRRGMVCVNAGIDKSNVEGEYAYSLLPVEPFRSSQTLLDRLRLLSDIKRLGVVIADSSTRPYRRGLTHYALSCAGIKCFMDYRGGRDIFGRVLMVKVSAKADEIACAAGLAMGEGEERIGAALIRGLDLIVEEEGREKLTVDRCEDIYRSIA